MKVQIWSGTVNNDPDNRDFRITLLPESLEEAESLRLLWSSSSVGKTFKAFTSTSDTVDPAQVGVGVTVALVP